MLSSGKFKGDQGHGQGRSDDLNASVGQGVKFQEQDREVKIKVWDQGQPKRWVRNG